MRPCTLLGVVCVHALEAGGFGRDFGKLLNLLEVKDGRRAHKGENLRLGVELSALGLSVEASALALLANISTIRRVVCGLTNEPTNREFATKTVVESVQESPGECGQDRPGEAFPILPST